MALDIKLEIIRHKILIAFADAFILNGIHFCVFIKDANSRNHRFELSMFVIQLSNYSRPVPRLSTKDKECDSTEIKQRRMISRKTNSIYFVLELRNKGNHRGVYNVPLILSSCISFSHSP